MGARPPAGRIVTAFLAVDVRAAVLEAHGIAALAAAMAALVIAEVVGLKAFRLASHQPSPFRRSEIATWAATASRCACAR